MKTEDRVRQFIVKEVAWDGPADQLSDDFPLIEKDLIDSLGIYHVVSFVEEEFDIEVLDEELLPEHFGTIGGIARLVDAKRQRQ
jgi:acyl carrier protein